MAIKIPTSVTDPTPVAEKGWTATTAQGVLTFAGGPLAAKTRSTFEIKATMPKTPTTLTFPAIQTCLKGETAWIESSPAGKPEPDHPAPQVSVVK